MSREEWGSWLEGTPAGGSSETRAENDGRGARLGLPADGTGSLARLGRRVIALIIDWGASLLISNLIAGNIDGLLPVGIFALENLVLIGISGSTFGHRLCGMRVARLAQPRATSPGVIPTLVRTVLLCLVIPAVVWDADGRGMHDRLAGTALVRR